MPPALLKMKNVVLTPHLGSAVMEVRDQMANIVVDNIQALIDGRMPPNCVNPQVLKPILTARNCNNREEDAMAELPKLDVVIGNNFGHLPMFIGAEKGFFKQHGVDAKMLVVDTGTDMVNAMHDGRAQIGDMSTTTYLKAVHAGEPFKVIGLIMNDATNDNCDDAARHRHQEGHAASRPASSAISRARRSASRAGRPRTNISRWCCAAPR